MLSIDFAAIALAMIASCSLLTRSAEEQRYYSPGLAWISTIRCEIGGNTSESNGHRQVGPLRGVGSISTNDARLGRSPSVYDAELSTSGPFMAM